MAAPPPRCRSWRASRRGGLEDDELLFAVRALHDERLRGGRGGGAATGRDDQASTATIASIAQTERTTTQTRCISLPPRSCGPPAPAERGRRASRVDGRGRCAGCEMPMIAAPPVSDGGGEHRGERKRVAMAVHFGPPRLRVHALGSTTAASASDGARLEPRFGKGRQAAAQADDGVDAAAGRLARARPRPRPPRRACARSRARGRSRPRPRRRARSGRTRGARSSGVMPGPSSRTCSSTHGAAAARRR